MTDWEDPGAHAVSPGVHRIPLPLPGDGLRSVNAFALTHDRGVTLIDPGWAIPRSREQLEQALRGLGHELHDVRRVLVTHCHRDHYSQAVQLRREVGTHIALGAGERSSLHGAAQATGHIMAPQTARLRRLGADALADAVERAVPDGRDERGFLEPPDEWVGAGVVRTSGRDLESVPTPGHTAGHVVFHDLQAGLLFAGDHVLPTITPSIGFEPVLSPEPLRDFLGSLVLVRSRPDAILLPAHGAVGPSVHARVDELLDHHGRRLDETLAACLLGAVTAGEVARQLLWTRRLRRLDELDVFNQMLAVLETAAHLDLLVAQERLHLCREDGVQNYAQSAASGG